MSHKRPPPQSLIAQVLERDAYRCVFCRMSNAAHVALYGSQLQIHHILCTGGLPPEVRKDTVDVLITVCLHCHGVHHALTRKLIDYLRRPDNHILRKKKPEDKKRPPL